MSQKSQEQDVGLQVGVPVLLSPVLRNAHRNAYLQCGISRPSQQVCASSEILCLNTNVQFATTLREANCMGMGMGMGKFPTLCRVTDLYSVLLTCEKG